MFVSLLFTGLWLGIVFFVCTESSLVLTEVAHVMPKIDAVPFIIDHHLPSSPLLSGAVQLLYPSKQPYPPFLLISQIGVISQHSSSKCIRSIVK
jgi:hypothetical protein